jgi:hypothetical protein
MKKRIRMVLPVLVTLAMVVSMFGMALPAIADQSPPGCGSNDFVLNVAKSTTFGYDETHPLGPTTITYTVSAGNPNTSGFGCDVTDMDISLETPDGVIHPIVTGVDYPIGTPVTVLDTVDYVVDSAHLTPSGTVTYTVIAEVTGYGNLNDVPGADDYFDITKPVTVIIIHPDTLVDIDASAYLVYAGDTVDLYVSEENTGDDPLTDVEVVVDDGTITIATLDETSPSWDDGAGNDDAVLDPGETWTWTISGVTVNAFTTFTATGTGTDRLGNPVTIPEYPEEEDTVDVDVSGNEGCTPGYWKNNAKNWGAVSWVGYAPGDSFECVFGVDVTLRANGKATYPTPTLLQALDANGGGINALARHAVAALLNISNPNINYAGGMSTATLILAVQDAVAAGEDAIEALHTELAGYNEAGCPINQRGEPIMDGIVI